MKAEKGEMTSSKHRLEVMRGAMPTTRAITIFAADGTLLARSPDQFVGQNFGDREYFKLARQGGNPQRLYIAQPFLAKTGEYVLNVSKILLDDNGAFAGVILASLGPEYFDTLLRSVLYDQDMQATLIHGGGKIISTVPGQETVAGNGPALALELGAFFSKGNLKIEFVPLFVHQEERAHLRVHKLCSCFHGPFLNFLGVKG